MAQVEFLPFDGTDRAVAARLDRSVCRPDAATRTATPLPYAPYSATELGAPDEGWKKRRGRGWNQWVKKRIGDVVGRHSPRARGERSYHRLEPRCPVWESVPLAPGSTCRGEVVAAEIGA